MASNTSPRLTEKEVREIYESLTKEQLVNILVKKFKETQERNDSIPWKKNNPTLLIGF